MCFRKKFYSGVHASLLLLLLWFIMDDRHPPPLNQAALLRPSSDDEEEDEEEENEENILQEEETKDDMSFAIDSTNDTSFQAWFEDQRNVQPDMKVAYIMMMMTTLDETFSLEGPPYNHLKKGRRTLKPTLTLYKKEVRRRDPTIPLSNKKIESILSLLRGQLRLNNSQDIQFVIKKKDEFTAALLNAVAASETNTTTTTTAATGSTRCCKKSDRMRFIECMVLDSVKPLYFKVHEVMTRQELDGRNSSNAPTDFYDEVTKVFNDASFVPLSRRIPELHEDFSDHFELPLSGEFRMTPDKAKTLIATMKNRIAKIRANFELSGNGDGMRGGDDDDDDDDNNPPAPREFNVTNCIAGNDRRCFLMAGDTSDILYWWHVLEESEMLQYTLSFLVDAGASSDSIPSVLTSTSDKRKRRNTDSDETVIQKIGVLSGNWQEDNLLKREANAIQKDRITFEKESFTQQMAFNDKKMALDVRRMALDEMTKVRELERDLEALEDQLDETENPAKRMRIQARIENLQSKVSSLISP